MYTFNKIKKTVYDSVAILALKTIDKQFEDDNIFVKGFENSVMIESELFDDICDKNKVLIYNNLEPHISEGGKIIWIPVRKKFGEKDFERQFSIEKKRGKMQPIFIETYFKTGVESFPAKEYLKKYDDPFVKKIYLKLI